MFVLVITKINIYLFLTKLFFFIRSTIYIALQGTTKEPLQHVKLGQQQNLIRSLGGPNQTQKNQKNSGVVHL